jgi:hypothetical protein
VLHFLIQICITVEKCTYLLNNSYYIGIKKELNSNLESLFAILNLILRVFLYLNENDYFLFKSYMNVNRAFSYS